MSRTRRFFSGAAVAILITSAIGLSPQQLATAAAKTFDTLVDLRQHSMKKSHRSSATAARGAFQRNYELLVRTEPPSDDSRKGPAFALTLRNNSQETIYVGETGRIRDFVLEIRDSSGKTIVPDQPGPERLIVNEGGKHSLVTVAAGQEVSYHIDLADAYNLPSGQYELTAKKVVLLIDMRTTLEVRSDVVRFQYESSQ